MMVHPSISPIDKNLVVIDSYPNRARIADVKILRDNDPEGKDIKVIARVFAPFKYDNDTRCDLHPRWSEMARKFASILSLKGIEVFMQSNFNHGE